MTSIQITIQSEEYESINIELSSEEVTALYKLRKENAVKIAELEKQISDLESNKKYAETAKISR